MVAATPGYFKASRYVEARFRYVPDKPRVLKNLAAEHCGGRLVLVLEGGYDHRALGYSVQASLAVLLNEEPEDPIGPATYPETPVDRLIARVRSIHGLAD